MHSVRLCVFVDKRGSAVDKQHGLFLKVIKVAGNGLNLIRIRGGNGFQLSLK